MRFKLGFGAGVLLLLVAGLLVSGWWWYRTRSVPVIAVLPETTAQELWESEHVGTVQVARQLGWKVYWNAPVREDDFQRQIELVEQSIARKVDGLILAPDHAVALISPVRKAIAYHIPIVIVASPLEVAPGDGIHYVINNEQTMGRLGAERAAQYLKDGDTAVIIGTNNRLIASIDRADAFRKTLQALRPGVKVEERQARSTAPAEAEETAESVVRSEPHLRVVFTLNIYQTRAAMVAIHRHGKRDKIKLIACDQDLDLIYYLRSGDIDAVLAQDTRRMGQIAMQAIDAMHKGKSVELRQVVEPMIVTRENVDTEVVQQALSMDWRNGA